LIKEEEEWVTATEEDEEDILRHFSIVENIIKRKIKWNDRYVQKINQESLWKLVWMFRNGQEEIEFQATALVICKRVLYAATYPFAYIFSTYKDSAEHRGLPDSPHWAPAAALLDGLIEWGLAEELTREKPLAALSEELDRITNYNWGITYNIEEEYNAKPIDRNFMMAINEELLDRDGALLRLDAGIGSFIIAGMHVNDVEVFNQLMHPLGIYPKYFTYVYEEEEAALRSNAEQLLHVARERLPEKMAAYRGHQDAFWEYVYHERGDVKFWQEWIEDLKTTLTVQAGSSYIFRGEDNIKPMHPEIEHWIDWCEKYDPISEGSHIIMPEED